MSEVTHNTRSFYVQIVDTESGYAISESYVGSHNPKTLCEILEIDEKELSPTTICLLEGVQLDRARRLFNVKIEEGENEVQLISWSDEDGLPYRIHSNRELILMIEGIKPLSSFVGTIPEKTDFKEIPDHIFRKYVENGEFICREYCEPIAGATLIKGFRVVLYALKGEEWRIDAYILVRSLARRLGWSEPLIRMEGTLLGYSEWQNDAFIVNMNKRSNS